MSIHCCVILRQSLEEIYKSRDVVEDLDSGLHHLGYLILINVSVDGLINKRHSSLKELVHIHPLDVFAVHPLKLCIIKNRGRLINMSVIKELCKLLK